MELLLFILLDKDFCMNTKIVVIIEAWKKLYEIQKLYKWNHLTVLL